MNYTPDKTGAAYQGWQKITAKYNKPSTSAGIWQLINSIGGLILCWIVMFFLFQAGFWWASLLVSIPAGGFLVRIFIIQHDCGHGSFFKDKQLMVRVGILCSFFTFVPYYTWRKSHAIHHADHAKLDDRGTGDVWTLTVQEYLDASKMKRLAYRIFRNPLFLFGIAPAVQFVILYRFTRGVKKEWKKERQSVHVTNLVMAAVVAFWVLLSGWVGMLLILILPIVIASSAGVWLFYVQHQFEDTYWENKPE